MKQLTLEFSLPCECCSKRVRLHDDWKIWNALRGVALCMLCHRKAKS